MPKASNVYKSIDNGIILRQAQYKSATPAESNKNNSTYRQAGTMIFYKPLNPQGSENRNKNSKN